MNENGTKKKVCVSFLVCAQASFSVKAGRCPSQMERKVLSCCVTRESLFNNTWPRMARLAHKSVFTSEISSHSHPMFT